MAETYMMRRKIKHEGELAMFLTRLVHDERMIELVNEAPPSLYETYHALYDVCPRRGVVHVGGRVGARGGTCSALGAHDSRHLYDTRYGMKAKPWRRGWVCKFGRYSKSTPVYCCIDKETTR